MLRKLDTAKITEAVAALCVHANKRLPCDIEARLRGALQDEASPVGRDVLQSLLDNCAVAKELDVPVCQDTGMATVFVEVGMEVQLSGAPLEEAVNAGVAKGYTEGLLRCSVVRDPLRRVNTGDNTPAVLHTHIVPGDRVKITVAPKGFGSENMSAMRMFTPAAGAEEIVDFVVRTVEKAGSNPCPPVVVGVGIGGNFEYCAYLAKKALCRSTDTPNPDEFYAALEREMLEKVNALGIGPQGFGGAATALAVNIEAFPTHIAGLPVAVNMGCHVTRHETVWL